MEGILSETPSADTSQPYVQEWAARFQKLFNAEPTGAFQSNSYDQIIIMALAMQKGGAATGEAIAQNYHKVTDVNSSRGRGDTTTPTGSRHSKRARRSSTRACPARACSTSTATPWAATPR